MQKANQILICCPFCTQNRIYTWTAVTALALG